MMMDDTFDPDELSEYDPVHPPSPDHREQRCSDFPALLLLFASLVCAFGVQVYAYRQGDVRKLIYGFDSMDRRCGIDLPENKFLFWCKDLGQVQMTEHVCLPDCPHGDEGTVKCFNNQTKEQTVLYTYKTYKLVNFCLPHNRKQAKALWQASVGKTHLRQWLMVWEAVSSSWPLLVLALAISIGVGYAYLLLLRRFAAQLVRLFMLLLIILSLFVGACYVWVGSTGRQSHSFSTGDPRADIAIGVALIGVSVMADLFALCFTGMDTAIGCIEAASECVFHELTIFWEPFASLCVKVALFVYISRGLLLLLSCATMHPLDEYGILPRLELTLLQWFYIGFHLFMGLWLVEISASTSHYVIAWMTKEWYFKPVIEDAKHATNTWGFCLAYSSALRSHMGTLALGSLLIMVLRPVRFACAVLVFLAKAFNTCLGPFAAACCASLIEFYQEILQRFRKSAFVDVALTQRDFSKAAKRAVDIIYNEVPAVATTQGAQYIFLVSGVGTISLVPALVIWAVCEVTSYSNLQEGSAFRPKHPDCLYPVIIIMCMSVGFSFMLVFDAVVDSIFYCFAVNQRRHRKQKRLNRHAREAARDLRDEKYQKASFLEFVWSTLTDENEESVETEEETPPEYAPARLRQLIKNQDELYH